MSSPDPTLSSWNEKLTIETPEQTSLQFPLAGVGSRCLALLLDSLFQFATYAVLGILFAILESVNVVSSEGSERGVWVTAIFVIVLFVVYMGYFAIFESIWNGQTPGKRIAHLRVIQESGKPIQVSQAVVRNLMRLIDSLPGFYAVGLVSAMISKQNRRLGDFAAGTVVVHERPLTVIGASWAVAPSAPVTIVPLGAAKLDAQDMQIIETFFERRSYLDGQTRLRFARQIAHRVADKLGVDMHQTLQPGHFSEEAFLEAVARERSSNRV
jgi:uncharacterized RDD family membrane protein YckC